MEEKIAALFLYTGTSSLSIKSRSGRFHGSVGDIIDADIIVGSDLGQCGYATVAEVVDALYAKAIAQAVETLKSAEAECAKFNLGQP